MQLATFGTTKHNHFELFRFDMLFDAQLNLFLLEINMSPNLMVTHKTTLNKFLFENLLYNLFRLVGIGTIYEKESVKFPDVDHELMIAHPNGLTVAPEICLSVECSRCGEEKCWICWHCMNDDEKFDLIQAHQEQINVGDFKRLFPPEGNLLYEGEKLWPKLSSENRKLLRWFQEICKKNKKFC